MNVDWYELESYKGVSKGMWCKLRVDDYDKPVIGKVEKISEIIFDTPPFREYRYFVDKDKWYDLAEPIVNDKLILMLELEFGKIG